MQGRSQSQPPFSKQPTEVSGVVHKDHNSRGEFGELQTGGTEASTSVSFLSLLERLVMYMKEMQTGRLPGIHSSPPALSQLGPSLRPVKVTTSLISVNPHYVGTSAYGI